MALSGKLEAEVEVHSPAAKFFSLFVTQLHHVQNISDLVHETKVHQGDWHGVGSDSVKHWTYTAGKLSPNTRKLPYKSLKAKLQVADKGSGALAKWTYEYEKLSQEVPPPQAYLDFVTTVTKDLDAHLTKA
ncbi:MLP-like protein 43 [Neltuma alba]|uniref:MLP-like protein 43 n=1 Tax=Neltuma alba TaxID=207710 RepID=UPI0010A46537|nr:MLP-like protein 43 [Prosopis alba]